MDSSASDSEREVRPTCRKRQRKSEDWKSEIAKRKRNRGDSYVSRSTKQPVAARSVGPPCPCLSKCFTKVGRANIQEIFETYWGLADYYAQTA